VTTTWEVSEGRQAAWYDETMSTTPFGQLLQHWRRFRGKSQLDLAVEAEVSARHVSFVETGRSSPSREMVLLLASALQVPLREQNALLLAAGYAPAYRETQLGAPELAHARQALDLILAQQAPYPAVVMNRQWDIVTSNEPAQAFFTFLLEGSPPRPGSPNVLRLMFDPDGLRPWVTNWEEVAAGLVQRVHREAIGGVTDDATKRVLAECLAQPGVPERWRSLDPSVELAPIVPVSFRKGDLSVRYFSTVTTLGTPQDITLQELRIECFFPADEETRRKVARPLALPGAGCDGDADT
jgi:transcriptional regulator with XRE-family HTH domain